jgi:xylulose-5-phosphate/fructose-6-phosphate phosphoketolase
MIILRTPKGWTAPNDLDGHRLEGSWRAHQIPIPDVVDNPAHLQLLEAWMRRYRPEELFDAEAIPTPTAACFESRSGCPISAHPPYR